MSNITVTIEMPAVVQALNNLAAAMGHTIQVPSAAPAAQPAPAPAPVAAPIAQPAPAPAPVAAPIAQPAPVHVAAPIAQPAPAPAPVAAPIAQPQAITRERIQQAAAEVVQAGRQAEAQQLLARFGLQSLAQLQEAQLGAFATELRGLGAHI